MLLSFIIIDEEYREIIHFFGNLSYDRFRKLNEKIKYRWLDDVIILFIFAICCFIVLEVKVECQLH